MIELQRRFEQRLREQGLRMTAVRREIVGHAFRYFGHFSAEELLSSLQRRGSKVSRATVYRTLTHLLDAGLLRRYDLGERGAVYEAVLGRAHHEHLICDSCGAILEFVQDDIERLQDEICRSKGFLPLAHTLQIHGICARCQRPRTARQSSGSRPARSSPAPGSRKGALNR